MARARRIDANQPDVIATLRATGWSVVNTSQIGDGFSDLIAARRGVVVFVEVKDGAKPPSAQKLTPAEGRFRTLVEAAGMPYRIVRSVEEASQL